MPQFMIESTHTAEECLKTLDEISAQGPDALRQWHFACAAGDHSNHTAYGIIDAPDASTAMSRAGETARAKSHAIEVGALTQDQIRAFHQAA